MGLPNHLGIAPPPLKILLLRSDNGYRPSVSLSSPPPYRSSMDPFHAKLVAAASGSTLTALTSKLSFVALNSALSIFLVTPFDVVKTRLQTQPVRPQLLFPQPPPNTCCQPTKAEPCIRNTSPLSRSMSSLARPVSHEVVCIWHNGVFRTEQVNGFYDAVRHVWRAEGIRGLWKGAGTSL